MAPLLAGQDGVLTSAQLRRRGISGELLRSWVSAGRLVRLRRNVLVDGGVWRAAPPWDRHLIRARGVMLDRVSGADRDGGACREDRAGLTDGPGRDEPGGSP